VGFDPKGGGTITLKSSVAEKIGKTSHKNATIYLFNK